MPGDWPTRGTIPLWAAGCGFAAALGPVLPIHPVGQVVVVLTGLVGAWVAATRRTRPATPNDTTPEPRTDRLDRQVREEARAMATAITERLEGDLMAELPNVKVPELRMLADVLAVVLAEREADEGGVQAMRMPIIEVGRHGRVERANPAAIQLFGYQNPGELVLEDVQVLLANQEDRSWALQDSPPEETEACTGDRRTRQTLALRGDGSSVHVELEIADHTSEHIVIRCKDITAQKAIEAEMEKARDTALHAADLQAQFLANMSHELRTPVNGILGMVQALLDGDLKEEARESAEIIDSCGQTLLTLINDILDLSKLDAGGVVLEHRQTNLRKLAQEVCTLLEPRAAARGNELELDYPEHQAVPTHARVDGVRLRQVLLNLVGNAVKFTENGNICIRIRHQPASKGPAFFSFEVEDTGIGIPESKLEHIFERFVQAERSTTRKFGGTGLGLPISKQLVELMGGTITVQSSSLGTYFRVELPLELCAAPTTANTPVAAPAHMEGLTVLVAEDNPVNQKITVRILRKLGCDVTLVENGEQAATAAIQTSFDVVLMDCMMPEVDGYEATRRIRAHEKGTARRTPVVALTARAMEGDREECLAAGMDDYLTKPFSLAALKGTLQRCIDGQPPAGPSDSFKEVG